MNSYCNTQTNRCCVKGREDLQESCFGWMRYLYSSDYGDLTLSNVFDRYSMWKKYGLFEWALRMCTTEFYSSKRKTRMQ